MRPQFSRTTFSWRAKNAAVTSRSVGADRERVDHGGDGIRRHSLEQAAVLGDSTSGPRAHSPRQPTRRTATSAMSALDDELRQRVDDAVGAEREAARRLAHVGAGAHGTLAGSRRGSASGVRGGAPGVPLDLGRRRSQAAAPRATSGLGAQLAVDVAVDHDDRGDAARADAMGGEDRHLTIARGLSSVDAESRHDARRAAWSHR